MIGGANDSTQRKLEDQLFDELNQNTYKAMSNFRAHMQEWSNMYYNNIEVKDRIKSSYKTQLISLRLIQRKMTNNPEKYPRVKPNDLVYLGQRIDLAIEIPI